MIDIPIYKQRYGFFVNPTPEFFQDATGDYRAYRCEVWDMENRGMVKWWNYPTDHWPYDSAVEHAALILWHDYNKWHAIQWINSQKDRVRQEQARIANQEKQKARKLLAEARRIRGQKQVAKELRQAAHAARAAGGRR